MQQCVRFLCKNYYILTLSPPCSCLESKMGILCPRQPPGGESWMHFMHFAGLQWSSAPFLLAAVGTWSKFCPEAARGKEAEEGGCLLGPSTTSWRLHPGLGNKWLAPAASLWSTAWWDFCPGMLSTLPVDGCCWGRMWLRAWEWILGWENRTDRGPSTKQGRFSFSTRRWARCTARTLPWRRLRQSTTCASPWNSSSWCWWSGQNTSRRFVSCRWTTRWRANALPSHIYCLPHAFPALPSNGDINIEITLQRAIKLQENNNNNGQGSD